MQPHRAGGPQQGPPGFPHPARPFFRPSTPTAFQTQTRPPPLGPPGPPPGLPAPVPKAGATPAGPGPQGPPPPLQPPSANHVAPPHTPQQVVLPAPATPPPFAPGFRAAPAPSPSHMPGLVPGFRAQGPPPTFQPPFSGPPASQSALHPPFTGNPQMAPPPMAPPLMATPPMVPPRVGPPQLAPPPTFGPGGAPALSPGVVQQQRGGWGAGGVQGLAEEFESLSVGQPGAMGGPGGAMDAAGPDSASLPRPLGHPDVAQTVGPANAHPRYVRLTTNAVPNSQSLKARWHLPLGAVVHPLAQAPPGEEVPVVNFGASGIVRCRRCRTYINPYVTFVDGGRRWRCNVCQLLNEVPVDYFCVLDSSGRRLDASQRPELSHGSVEFEAPAEYMVRPPMPPAFLFLIDVSASATSSGMMQVLSDTVKRCLDSLPGDSRTQVAFLTFDASLHFFSLKPSLSQPQMMVVSELDDVFLPLLPDDLMVNLSESRAVVDALLDTLPGMFHNNTCVESALGPALKAAYMIMNRLGGKLLLFQSTLPSLSIGRLRLRGDDGRLYGSDREHTLRVTEDSFYKTMAADCSRVQISCNVYAFGDKYSDLASLGTLSRYTTGQVYFYPGFQLAKDGDRFAAELARDLTREVGWEAVMRIRCGKGLKISSFHGHFFVRSVDLLALPAVDCDKAFAVQISHEEALLASQSTVYFQAALLYTSSSGERRIRVHTVATPVVADLGEMYRAADAGAMVAVLGKLAVDRALTSRLEDARQLIQQKLVQGLKEYRALHAAHYRTTGRLIFPPSLKLLPLYALGLSKSLPLKGGADVPVDQRSWAMYELMNMSVGRTLKLIYPTLIRLDEMPPDAGKPGKDKIVVLPPALPPATTSLDIRGAFLLDNGLQIMIWMGKELRSDWLGQLTGNQELYPGMFIKSNGTDVSNRVVAVVEELKRENGIHQQIFVTRPGDYIEPLFFSGLIEDRGQGTMSYPDFITNVYRLVQQK